MNGRKNTTRRSAALALYIVVIVCALQSLYVAIHLRVPEMSASTRESSDSLGERCRAATSHLSSIGINFLAIDFDQTMIDVHTGGRWKESSSDLVKHLRPVFLNLLPAAADVHVHIAIVTFSGQTSLIREVLELAFPGLAETIPIRGNDMTWRYEGNGMKLGKQQHMASAVEELLRKPPGTGIEITKATTLLIDDDPRNIRKAIKDKTRAVWIDPRNPNRLLDDILRLI